MQAVPVIMILLLILIIVLLTAAPLTASENAINNKKTGKGSPNEAIPCRMFPANNIWNTPIDTLPLDPNSSRYVQTIGASRTVHPDFGSGTWNGAPIGIPFITVPGSQAKVAVSFYYPSESDPGPYPIPANAPIEGGPDSTGDRHVLVVDRTNCILYELYDAHPQGDGTWTAGSGAIFNLKSNTLRPNGWTSADAAGLPILPGLIRYEEVAAGEIKHAIRFTAPQTRRAYVWPARHYASSLTGTQYPPMGQRFRLKASFNTSGYSTHARVILTAMKKYGIILADNGSAWFISGAPDQRWNNTVLRELKQVRGSDFEAVDVSSLMVNANSGAVAQQQAKSITVTVPRGGEQWNTGTGYTIKWTTSGSVANVNIQLLKNDRFVSTIVNSTTNDGSHRWTIPANTPLGTDYKIKITDTVDTGVTDNSGQFEITRGEPEEEPEIWLNRKRLNAGAVFAGSASRPQRFLIRNSGEGTLNWSLSDDAAWLTTSPASGTGSRFVSVKVNSSGLEAGTYTATITVRAGNAVNSPQKITVKLTVVLPAVDQPPIGVIETPKNNAAIRGSVAVTGWALDDVEVEGVRIYLQQGTTFSKIGDATLVEGARPDVETAYPDYPFHYQAGWGYMMLSNYLPDNGNGTFKIVAIARDGSGQETVLGSRIVKADNANGVKPFGAIDTPDQGGEATGTAYVNWGWALTPMPNSIPTDGSTIRVYINGEFAGRPVYNLYRPDIARLFPGYANTDGAVGYFKIDTAKYSDGVHSIQWTVTDSAGNTDGIGSRFFTVNNSGSSSRQSRAAGRDAVKFPGSRTVTPSRQPVSVRRGWGIDDRESVLGNALGKGACEMIFPGDDGKITVKIRELQRVVIDLENRYSSNDATFNREMEKSDTIPRFKGYMRVGDHLRPLPIGSTLDAVRGVFYWQPGPGFVGTYSFVFVKANRKGYVEQRNITIEILPRIY